MFPTVFSPFSLRGLALKNRIVSTPHSDGMAEDGLPRAWHAHCTPGLPVRGLLDMAQTPH